MSEYKFSVDSVDLNGAPLKNLGAPTGPNDAASQSYVDDAVAAGGSGGLTWTEVSGEENSMDVNTGYIANDGALVGITLPLTSVPGDMISVVGKGAGGWQIEQNDGQVIHFGSVDTTTGTSGGLASSAQYDVVNLLCISADTDWLVTFSIGSIEIDPAPIVIVVPPPPAIAPIFKLAQVNSLPIVRFDGVLQILQIPYSPTMDATTDLHVFVVAQANNSGNAFQSFVCRNTTDQNAMPAPIAWTLDNWRSGGNGLGLSVVTANWNVSGTNVSATGSYQLLYGAWDGVTSSVNGNPAVDFNPGGPDTPSGSIVASTSGMQVGGSDSVPSGNSGLLNGDIAEILVFPHTLTGPEAVSIQDHLNQKYNFSPGSLLTNDDILALDPCLWLKADSLLGQYADDAEVTTWQDCSGKGNNAYSVVPTFDGPSAPTYIAAGLNSLPAVNFGGGTQFMTITGNDSQNSAHISVFAVWQFPVPSSSPGWFVVKPASDFFQFLLGDGASGGGSDRNALATKLTDTGNMHSNSSFDLTNNQWYQTSIIYDGLDLFYRHNGIVDSYTTNYGSPINGGDIVTQVSNIDIGGSTVVGGAQAGVMAEFIYFTRALNDTERDNIEGYLFDKYNLNPGAAFDINTIPDLKIWFKADALTGLSDTDPLTILPDSSGNGNNALAH